VFDRPNSAIFLAASLDACALWRLYMPHLSLPGSGYFWFSQTPDFSIIAGHDVCVVQRCYTGKQFKFLDIAAKLNMKIIYDLDDDVWDLPTYNPAHDYLKQYREGFKACMRIVDVVTVSTKTLAKIVRKNMKVMVNPRTGKEIPIIVVENRLYQPMCAPASQSDDIVIGWGGSTSHIGDLAIVESTLAKIGEDYANVTIEFRGCEVAPGSPLTKIKNFRHFYWQPVAEYCVRMPRWNWSIALAPVTDHPFNSSKSCIKMIEAAYCKIPCLASWVRPYEEFCYYDQELVWLLCAGQSSWDRKLRELINDTARREFLGERMHKVMLEHYTYDKPHEGWAEALAIARHI
jgi:hypothetical protein